MPRELVNRLSVAIIHAQKQPEVVQMLATTGTIPLILGPDELKSYIAAEVAKWVRLAREANIQPE
jgi:tripartite-type tricarboxylate transporter receptor subunit TctC